MMDRMEVTVKHEDELLPEKKVVVVCLDLFLDHLFGDLHAGEQISRLSLHVISFCCVLYPDIS